MIVSVSAVFLAVQRAQHTELSRQRLVLEELQEFQPHASWNSDGVWALEFQPGPRRLDDDHLAKLGELPGLWALDLRETQITDRGLRQIAAIPSVRWVVLPRTGITAGGIGELEQQRPDLKVVCFPPPPPR